MDHGRTTGEGLSAAGAGRGLIPSSWWYDPLKAICGGYLGNMDMAADIGTARVYVR